MRRDKKVRWSTWEIVKESELPATFQRQQVPSIANDLVQYYYEGGILGLLSSVVVVTLLLIFGSHELIRG